MTHWTIGPLFAAGSFVGILLMLDLGRRLRRRRADGGVGLGAVEGAVFALMGLLVAFTFSGAAARFDGRRQLIVEEANDLGTAYLRLDLLPPGPRAAVQESFRRYLDTRLEAYRAIQQGLDVVRAKVAEYQALQNEIWTQAVAGCQQSPQTACAVLLLPALNAVFDIASTRAAAVRVHPPMIIYGMLGVVALACALLAGFSMGAVARPSWLHVVGFAAILALTIWVTVDLEYPRLGLIRVDDFDQLLIDVRAGMR
jgi:hypothetical protein